MNKKLILTHANCVDGCCSRAILEQKFGNNAIYIAVDHIDYDPKFVQNYTNFMNKIKDIKNTEVIMSDICLPEDYINMFLNNNNSVVILDHHKTAMPIITNLENRIKNGEKLNLTMHCSKENKESGAMLTWEFLHGKTPAPEVVVYISEGDRWDFKHKETKYFYTGLLDGKEPNSYKPEEWIDLLTNSKLVNNIIEYGKPIHEEFMAKVEDYAKTAVPVILNGKKGLMAFTNSAYRSELGNKLAIQCQGFGFIIEEQDDKISCGLRSNKPFIVDDIAKKFGGGGHEQASAFKLKNLEELQIILDNEGNNINLFVAKKFKIK